MEDAGGVAREDGEWLRVARVRVPQRDRALQAARGELLARVGPGEGVHATLDGRVRVIALAEHARRALALLREAARRDARRLLRQQLVHLADLQRAVQRRRDHEVEVRKVLHLCHPVRVAAAVFTAAVARRRHARLVGAGACGIVQRDVAAVVAHNHALLQLVVPAAEAQRRRVETRKLAGKLEVGAVVKRDGAVDGGDADTVRLLKMACVGHPRF